MRSEIDVDVFEGERLVQRCACTAQPFPDGRPGAIWRGVTYPLLPGDRIDVGATQHREVQGQPFAVVAGEGTTWILVSGLASALTEARDRLEAGGIRVAHSGRWLGDTPEGSSFDWFLRCEGVVEVGQVGELLGANRTVVQTAEGRLAVLEQHLLEMRAALARLADELVVATRAPSTASLLQETRSANHDAILEATRDRVRELETRLAATPPNPAPARSSTARLQQELGAVLVALRPDVILLRDSLQVAVGEFASRTAFYRTLQELPVSGARPEGWKALRGSERWWERHVSNGQDDSGRAYARFDTRSRQWRLLLGWKGEQSRDIDWIRREG